MTRPFQALAPLLAAMLLSACVSHGGPSPTSSAKAAALSAADRQAIAETGPGRIAGRYRRQSVSYASSYAPGTVVVDTANRFLYLVEGSGRATRYGISVGVGGFAWSGEASVGLKRPWPKWTPPAEMIARAPNLARYRGGLAGGGINPLGARALYLYQNGRDTLYRLHGTSEWWTIGQSGSSGCIRLLNKDVIDLYEKVPLGARVVVLPSKPRILQRG